MSAGSAHHYRADAYQASVFSGWSLPATTLLTDSAAARWIPRDRGQWWEESRISILPGDALFAPGRPPYERTNRNKMNNAQKGFKTVEAIVGVSAILLFMGFAFPQCMKSREMERLAEVKSNIHAIQIALERYAVDSGGVYPTFLVGGDAEGNVIRSWIDMRGNGVSRFPVDGMTPFDLATSSVVEIEPGTGLVLDSDPLMFYRYISEYPRNPLAGRTRGLFALATESGDPGIYPYGGVHGDRMFDLGFGWGDTPQTQFVFTEADKPGDPPRLDAPGNFYYHPVFMDGDPAYMHYASIWADVNGSVRPQFILRPSRPIDYRLYGFGCNPRKDESQSRGLSVFDAMPSGDLPSGPEEGIGGYLGGRVLDSSVEVPGASHDVETTGYAYEDGDPWTGRAAGEPSDHSIANAEPWSVDGIGDWVIIAVSGGSSIVGPEFDRIYPYGENQESVPRSEFF
jgi:hypothetical protein